MKTNLASTEENHSNAAQYALRRQAGLWGLTFEGRQAVFKHELGALYVACLLLEPPREPVHAVALALKARGRADGRAGAELDPQERRMWLGEAWAVRALWRRQRELERVLQDRNEIEPAKAEALRELEEVTEFLRQSPWLSHHVAERCARAVAAAINGLHARLAAVDAEGKPDAVLRAFARHLREHLLMPSGRCGGPRVAPYLAGCFTCEPPAGVVWNAECEVTGVTCQVPGVECQVSGAKCQVRGSAGEGRGEKGQESGEQPRNTPNTRIGKELSQTAMSRVVRAGAPVICLICLALALLAAGCAGPRPLKGGKAVATHNPAGAIEQSLVQGENPSQATKQDQESVKVRTYTVPAGSRMEQSQMPGAAAGPPRSVERQRSTLNAQPSTAFVLSAPMPVVEREETRARSELGAAQKDTARDLAAKLSSLKGIVWVGVGLFVFGLTSLVWPPLKVVIGSVTTSAAPMLGGVALMVLPSLVVGNELLILGGVGLTVGGWFLAHRHGQLRGVVAASGNGQQASGTQAPAARA
jgi:hypothetical protein